MINPPTSAGFIPHDLLIAGAISRAIKDMRENPWQLQWLFHWFALDEATNKFFGTAEKKAAIDWFLKNEINVAPSFLRTDDIKLPMIVIELQSSMEAQAQLGDINPDTSEEITATEAKEVKKNPQIVLGPFTPKSYTPSTGTVELPTGTTSNLYEGMIYLDTNNNVGYPITAITSDTTFTIEEDVTANFTNSVVMPIESVLVASLESCEYKNTWSIKCFAQNEPRYLTYLVMVVRWILAGRYKQELLEKRGLDRSVVNLGRPYDASAVVYGHDSKEVVFGQDVTLTGFVREYWPKMIDGKVNGIKIQGLEFIGGTVSPLALLNQLNAQGWWNEEDPLPY